MEKKSTNCNIFKKWKEVCKRKNIGDVEIKHPAKCNKCPNWTHCLNTYEITGEVGFL
jgi:hypothetical protein